MTRGRSGAVSISSVKGAPSDLFVHLTSKEDSTFVRQQTTRMYVCMYALYAWSSHVAEHGSTR